MSVLNNRLDIGWAFLWRIVVACLLITDIFLFMTGNVSITGRFFGGVYLITKIILGMVIGSYIIDETRKSIYLILMILLAALFASSLFLFQHDATIYSSNKLKRLIASSINNHSYLDHDVYILGQNYSLDCDIFIPTIRRMDCTLKTENGVIYRVTGMIFRNGTLQVLVTPEAGSVN